MKVSIIMPVYNGEKYIGRSLKSIVNQEYRDLEIIVINDGSEDNTLKVVNEFNDSRIKVIDKENSGVSDSRNIGIDNSTGDYIMFLDSDDYVDKTIVSKLVKDVEEKSMVICDNYEIFKGKLDIRESLSCRKTNFNKKEVMLEIMEGRLGLVSSKLVDSQIIKENNIRFNRNLKICEDQLFFLEVASRCEKFKYVKEGLYYYDRTNETSTTGNYKENLLENYLYLQDKTENIFKSNFDLDEKDKRIINEKLFNSFRESLRNEVINNSSFSKKINNVGELIECIGKRIEFEYINGTNILYKEMIKSLRKDTFINRGKLILLMKILILKNG